MWCSQGLCQNALFINHTLSLGPKLSHLYLWMPMAATVAKILSLLSWELLEVFLGKAVISNGRWSCRVGTNHYFIWINQPIIFRNDSLTVYQQTTETFFTEIPQSTKSCPLTLSFVKPTAQRLFIYCDRWQSKAVNHIQNAGTSKSLTHMLLK